MIKLGAKVKDSVTGVEGIATSRTVYLNGCVRICLEHGKDGVVHEYFFDEQRLESKSEAKVGGSRPSPPSRDNKRW